MQDPRSTDTSQPQNPARFMPVAGAVMLLSRQCEIQACYRVAQLFDRVWPSLMRGHYCLYTEANGRPVGFCNWIMVSQAVLDEYLETNRAIKPEDWDSGDIPFFPEMIAPQGHLRQIIADLRDFVMPEVPEAYSLRGVIADQDGNVPEPRPFRWKGRPDGASKTGKQPPQGDKNIRML